MPSFTIQTLIDRAKAQADMHDDFVTDTQWMRWATVELAYLDGLISRSGYVYREATVPITIPQGALGQSLGEIRAIVAVYEIRNGRFRQLRVSDPWRRQVQSGTPFVDQGDAVEFYTNSTNAGVSIFLWPQPTSGSYVAITLPAPLTITTVADNVIYPLGWEEVVVLRLARRALIKEESDTRQVDRLLAEAEQQVQDDCWNRVIGQHNIRNDDNVERPYGRPVWPVYGEWVIL